MKNILNWTFGGFFRTLGRVLCFLVLGSIIGYLISLSGWKLPSWLSIMSVNADSFDYTLGQYRLQYHMGNNNTWRDPLDFNTSTDTTSYDYIKAFAVRLGNANKFVGMREYTVSIEVGYSPISAALNNAYTSPSSFSCGGSTSLNSWSADYSKVDSCEFVGATRVGNTNHIKYIYKIKMKQDIVGIQININLYDNPPYGINGFNVYKNTSITYGEDVSGAIDNQTIIIQNEINNLEEIINNNNQNLINSITDSSIKCTDYSVNSLSANSTNNAYLTSTGVLQGMSGNVYWTSDYISILDNYSITPHSFALSALHICYYTGAKQFISCTQLSSSNDVPLTIPFNASYYRFSVYVSSFMHSSFTICSSDNTSPMDNLLADTDTNKDSNSAASFFNDFTLSIEGPISQIVLLPIDLLNILIVDYNVNQTHNDLCTTFKGQTICLPSGDIVWKRSGCHDNNVWGFGCSNVTPFRNFLQLTVGGYIIYRLLRKLVESVEKGLDPQSTRVDLMKL